MQYDVTVRVEVDNVEKAIQLVNSSDFYYSNPTFISVTPVKEENR